MGKVVIIGGPTASGKTQAALDLARKFNGEIINADSMQLYAHLPTLTACPTEDEQAICPHHLFQILEPTQNFSAALWRDAAIAKIREVLSRDNLPIIVGGTGLYIQALVHGLMEIPQVTSETREQANQDWLKSTPEEFHKKVSEIDPKMGKRLHPNDKQRLTRVWEIYLETGKALSEIQSTAKQEATTEFDFLKVGILPDKTPLDNRADLRLDLMLKQGALDEIKELIEAKIPEDAPIYRVLGATQFRDFLKGLTSDVDALEDSKTTTHQYIKRQRTWFFNQYKSDCIVPEIYSTQTHAADLKRRIKKFLI